MVVKTCNSSYLGDGDRIIMASKANLDKVS
jgi:hypothetical protein